MPNQRTWETGSYLRSPSSLFLFSVFCFFSIRSVAARPNRSPRQTPQFPSTDMSIISKESGFISSPELARVFTRKIRMESNENRRKKMLERDSFFSAILFLRVRELRMRLLVRCRIEKKKKRVEKMSRIENGEEEEEEEKETPKHPRELTRSSVPCRVRISSKYLQMELTMTRCSM